MESSPVPPDVPTDASETLTLSLTIVGQLGGLRGTGDQSATKSPPENGQATRPRQKPTYGDDEPQTETWRSEEKKPPVAVWTRTATRS